MEYAIFEEERRSGSEQISSGVSFTHTSCSLTGNIKTV